MRWPVLIKAIVLACAWSAPGVSALQQLPRVSGRVTTDAGDPIHLANVTVVQPGGPTFGTVTGEDGAFVIEGVPPGEYTVRFQYIGYSPVEIPLSIKPGAGELDPLTIQLAVAPVELDPLTVEAEGRLPRLAAAGFYDRQEAGWGSSFDLDWIERNNDGYLRADRLVQRLLMSASRVCPVVEIYVDGRKWPGGSSSAALRELPAGEIVAAEVYPDMSGAPTFTFSLETMACGVVVLWTQKMLQGGAPIPVIEVELCEPTGAAGTVSVEGVVEDHVKGIRLPTTRVRASYTRSDENGSRNDLVSVADEDGRFRICDIPEGATLTLLPTFAGISGSIQVFDAEMRGDVLLTVAVLKTGTIAGRVVNREDDRGLSPARITLLGTGSQVTTSRQGEFSMGPLAVGSYRIQVTCEGFTPLFREVEVTESVTLRVMFELSALPGSPGTRCSR